jgi:tRNA pseudouridine32 synthase/23S rRNA pseudouridine746 synthase
LINGEVFDLKTEMPEIAFFDEHIVVVKKPISYAVQPARDTDLPDLVSWCRETLEADDFWVVHRLDVRASGLVLLARSQVVAAGLSAQFASRTAKRTYMARLSDHAPIEQGEELRIDAPILKERGRGFVSEQGKRAISVFRLEARSVDGDLVRVSLETGRFHQIRVHAKHINCPIWGDVRYGGPRADRMYLHGISLGFTHPNGVDRELQWAPPWGP